MEKKAGTGRKLLSVLLAAAGFVDVAGNPSICGIRRKPARRKGSIGRHVRDMEKPHI